MPSEAAVPTVIVEPFDAAAFAPFGRLLRHDEAGSPLQEQSGVFAGDARAAEASCALLRVEAAALLPRDVSRLERHPFSAQSFIPVDGGRCLAVVAPALASGAPDLPKLRAFAVEAPAGILYAPNVWHHSMLALTAPSTWLVLMRRTGRGDDNAFFDLAEPLRLAAESTAR